MDRGGVEEGAGREGERKEGGFQFPLEMSESLFKQ